MSNEFTILSSCNEEISPRVRTGVIAGVPKLSFADHYFAAGDYGQMDFQVLKLHYLTIWFSHYRMERPVVIRSRIEQPVLEAHITLQNRMAQSLGNSTNTLLESGEINITYTPFTENKAWFPEDGLYITFDIHPDLKLLQTLVPDFPLLDPFLNHIKKGTETSISLLKNRSFLSPDMLALTKKIIQYLQGPDATRSFTNVLCLELLMLFLLRSRPAAAAEIPKHNRYIDEMLHIREVLQKQADEYDCEDLYETEIQLAERVGLTIYQLKTSFRAAFGMGPYKMLMEFRFLKARRLLLDTKLSVIEIAMQTGYQSRESFIKAYTRRFGISPGSYRKNF